VVWFFLTVGSSLLWSVNNHLDKFMADRYYSGGALHGTLMFLTAMLGAIMSAAIFVVHPVALHLPVANVAVLLIVGVIDFVYVFPYIIALLRDEASRVAPLFQIGPVFSYLLATLFLGEHLTVREVIAGMIITLGAIGINLDIDNGFRLKRSVLSLMLLSTGLFSLETFLFKLGARDYGYWSGAAYQYLGAALAGLVLAVVSSRYRRDFARNLSRAPTRGADTERRGGYAEHGGAHHAQLRDTACAARACDVCVQHPAVLCDRARGAPHHVRAAYRHRSDRPPPPRPESAVHDGYGRRHLRAPGRLMGRFLPTNQDSQGTATADSPRTSGKAGLTATVTATRVAGRGRPRTTRRPKSLHHNIKWPSTTRREPLGGNLSIPGLRVRVPLSGQLGLVFGMLDTVPLDSCQKIGAMASRQRCTDPEGTQAKGTLSILAPSIGISRFL